MDEIIIYAEENVISREVVYLIVNRFQSKV